MLRMLQALLGFETTQTARAFVCLLSPLASIAEAGSAAGARTGNPCRIERIPSFCPGQTAWGRQRHRFAVARIRTT